VRDADQKFSSAALLRFYQWAGVVDAVGEEPVDRLAAPIMVEPTRQHIAPPAPNEVTTALPKPPRPASSGTSGAVIADGAPAALIATAREQARHARSLDELRALLQAYEGCPLKFTAKNTCFADGTPQSPLMLIGEAPGRDEDLAGLPFVGRSGQLLNLILKAIGLAREQVYIANTIPWRPPGNRTPTPLETELCRPFIERQIELARPKILVALGGPAAKSLTGAKEGILKLRGQWLHHQTAGGAEIPVMATLHPAYLLRTPSHKKFSWADFLEVKMRLRELGCL